MKSFFLLAFCTAVFCSCQPSEQEQAQKDSLNQVQDEKMNLASLNSASAENLFRFFSSNFHVVGNNPCMYYDAATDQYVICGKKLFTRIAADDREDAIASFHDFLCTRGYSPDGDSAREEYQKIKVEGKDMYVVQMDDLLPSLLPEERALFNDAQIAAMNSTACSVAYHYLGTERNYPNVYASSSSLTIEGKKIQKEIKMEDAKTALAAFCDYVDSTRKK